MDRMYCDLLHYYFNCDSYDLLSLTQHELDDIDEEEMDSTPSIVLANKNGAKRLLIY